MTKNLNEDYRTVILFMRLDIDNIFFKNKNNDVYMEELN